MFDKKYKKRLGAWGEAVAEKYYQSRGWQTIAKNHRNVGGEIDLLLKKDGQFLAVEVKTRHSQKYGWPEEAIDHHKLKKLINSAYYAQEFFHIGSVIEIEICCLEIKGHQARISRVRL